MTSRNHWEMAWHLPSCAMRLKFWPCLICLTEARWEQTVSVNCRNCLSWGCVGFHAWVWQSKATLHGYVDLGQGLGPVGCV